MKKTIIEPNGKNFQYWKDLWNYRELAFNFAKRDITVRYKQTKMGLGWAVVAPIINMIVSTFIFGTLAHLESDGATPYNIMVYSGTIAWNIFSKSITTGSNLFIMNADLMKKVYYPRISSAIGSSLGHMFDSLISMFILLLMMLFQTYLPPLRILLFPVFMILCNILGSGIGLFLASFNVKWRDLVQIVPFALSVGQYLCPVAYSIQSIPEKYILIYKLNPLTGFISAFKWCTLSDMQFDWFSFLVAIAWTAVILPLGIYRFRKVERTFVDIV